MLLGVAPADVVFAGFHSTAVWLVFGGVVIAAAVQESGLGARIVRLILAHAPRTYLRLLIALALVGAGLAFLIPAAMGRVVLYIPLVVALAERLGFDAGRPGRAGLVLAASLGTLLPAFAILPSNVPNMVMAGAAETILSVSFSYGAYLLLNYPVMGVLALIAIPLIVRVMFPDRLRPVTLDAEHRPWSAPERRLLVVLVLALALWISDFAHGVSPAWVALGAALWCLLPRVGLLPPNAVATKINFGPWLFVAGVIGMGSVATHAGVGQAVGEALLHNLPLQQHAGTGGDLVNFASVVLVGMMVAMVTTLPAAPAILTPLAEPIAAASGWPVESVALAQVPTWLFFPFPYEAPPLVVSIALANIKVRDALRCLVALALTGIVLILPLQFLWGRLLGYYG